MWGATFLDCSGVPASLSLFLSASLGFTPSLRPPSPDGPSLSSPPSILKAIMSMVSEREEKYQRTQRSSSLPLPPPPPLSSAASGGMMMQRHPQAEAATPTGRDHRDRERGDRERERERGEREREREPSAEMEGGYSRERKKEYEKDRREDEERRRESDRLYEIKLREWDRVERWEQVWMIQ